MKKKQCITSKRAVSNYIGKHLAKPKWTVQIFFSKTSSGGLEVLSVFEQNKGKKLLQCNRFLICLGPIDWWKENSHWNGDSQIKQHINLCSSHTALLLLSIKKTGFKVVSYWGNYTWRSEMVPLVCLVSNSFYWVEEVIAENLPPFNLAAAIWGMKNFPLLSNRSHFPTSWNGLFRKLGKPWERTGWGRLSLQKISPHWCHHHFFFAYTAIPIGLQPLF